MSRRQEEAIRALCPKGTVYTAPAREWQRFSCGDGSALFPNFWSYLFFLISVELGARSRSAINAMMGFWN